MQLLRPVFFMFSWAKNDFKFFSKIIFYPWRYKKKRPQKMHTFCPNQPDLPKQLKTHTAFSMFPIVDVNLWFLIAWLAQSDQRNNFVVLSAIVVDVDGSYIWNWYYTNNFAVLDLSKSQQLCAPIVFISKKILITGHFVITKVFYSL